MLRVCLNCYGTHTTDSVFQWDQNHELSISGDYIGDVSAIHFCNKKMDSAIVVNATREGDTITVPVPNQLLQEPYNIIAYVHSIANNQGKTIEIINIPLVTRPKPDEYEFTENVDIVNFERLEKDVNDFILSITENFEEFTSTTNANYEAFTASVEQNQNDFETEFTNEYNERVANGYFLGEEGATAILKKINDVDALNEATGSPILLTDSADGLVADFKVYGRSTQDGEATPDNPIEIASVGDRGYFDGELLNGAYDSSTGEHKTSTTYICSKNFIPCNVGDEIKLVYATTMRIVNFIFYDENKAFLSSSTVGNSVSEYTATAPTNAKYFTFNISESTSSITIADAKHITVTINDKYALIEKSKGKNWLSHTTPTQTVYGVTWTRNENGSFTANGTATENSIIYLTGSIYPKLKVPSASQPLIFGGVKGGSTSTYCMNVWRGSWVPYVYVTDGDYQVNTSSEDYELIVGLLVVKGVTVNNVVFEPMIRPVGTDDTYEPYKESVKYIPISAPLRSSLDGSVADVARLTDGEVERYRNKVTYNGSESGWTMGTAQSQTVFNIAKPKDVLSNANAICTHFTNDSKLSSDNTFYVGGSYINFRCDSITSVDEWVALLQTNSIEVEYTRTEPITETIEPTDIVTFEGVTHISVSDNADMWVQYYSDSNIGQRLANADRRVREVEVTHDRDILALNSIIGYGASKNLLKYPYDDSSTTIYTDNGDGSITMNGYGVNGMGVPRIFSLVGYQSDNSYRLAEILKGRTVRITGGVADRVTINVFCYKSDGTYDEKYEDNGGGVVITIPEDTSFIVLTTRSYGITYTDFTFYPMLTLASDDDNTWVPYVKDVDHRIKTLTTQLSELTSQLSDVATRELYLESWSNSADFSLGLNPCIELPDGVSNTDYMIVSCDYGFCSDEGANADMYYVIDEGTSGVTPIVRFNHNEIITFVEDWADEISNGNTWIHLRVMLKKIIKG